MDYREAADFLFDLRRFKIRPGTESVRALLAHLGDPHEDVTFVQVAGSNGKGSTARMVESVLRADGARVGLYTSPHLDDLRERVRVDDRKIPRAAVCEFVERAKPFLLDRAAAGEALTFFEAVTAMGLWYFDRADVDVAVLEVGLGGKYDATSVVDPAASAVTNVALEHRELLGDSVEEIATDKAQVAPSDGPLVTAATGEALAVIRESADEVLTVGSDGVDVTARYLGRQTHAESAVSLSGPDWTVETRLPLLGEYQAHNAGVAVALARAVRDVAPEQAARGLRGAHWPGRFEVVGRDPLVVFDGAHNPAACATVTETLEEFDYDDLHVVFAAMHDKDHTGMTAALPTPDSVVTCAPDLERSEDPEVLAQVFENAGVPAQTGDAVADAVAAARDRATADDCVLVVGSLFAVAEARTAWRRVVVPKTATDRASATRVLEAANLTPTDVARHRDDAVHRVVKLRLQRRQGHYLGERLLEAGGRYALAGVENGGELVDAVFTGTVAQFDAALSALADAPYGLSGVATTLRARLGFEADAASPTYPWTDRTAVMGVLNVTPDSFHDGGQYVDPDVAVARAEAMVAEGADVVDVGGESTRPGADEISVETELDRVLPVVEALADTDTLVSIDTRKASVGRAALDAGADILNDVTGLEDPEMRFLAAERGVPIVVMHSIDAPVVPGKDVPYDDVVEDVIDELSERVLLAEKAGVSREKIIVDPGLGFGKTAIQSFDLLGRLSELEALGCPVLIGHSHKSMFDLVGQAAGERLPATVAATALAAARGADIVRVHDVAANVAAVRTALAAADPDSVTGG